MQRVLVARQAARRALFAPPPQSRCLLPSLRTPSLSFASSSRGAPFLTRSPTSAQSQTQAAYASSTTAASSSFDPQERAAQDALSEGNDALEDQELDAAADAYRRSLSIKETAIAHYNLGVVQYQQQNLPAAIASFQKSVELSPKNLIPELTAEPSSEPLSAAQIVLADTFTNLGAAYILSKPPRPDLALESLQKALMICPDDGEVCYNLAAVLEATGEEEEALLAYQRSHKLGIERAAVNIRNIGGKLVAKRLKEERERLAATEKADESSSS